MNNLPISLLEQTKKHIKPNEFRFWEFFFFVVGVAAGVRKKDQRKNKQ